MGLKSRIIAGLFALTFATCDKPENKNYDHLNKANSTLTYTHTAEEAEESDAGVIQSDHSSDAIGNETIPPIDVLVDQPNDQEEISDEKILIRTEKRKEEKVEGIAKKISIKFLAKEFSYKEERVNPDGEFFIDPYEIDNQKERMRNMPSLRERVSNYLDNHNLPERIRKKLKKTLVVDKSKRTLSVYVSHRKPKNKDDYGTLLKQYKVSIGSNKGDKVRVGDFRTPVGKFYVAHVRNRNQTMHYKALYLSYPSMEDAKRGLRDKIINRSQYYAIQRAHITCKTPPSTPLGSAIEIHGEKNMTDDDWTYGCVAVMNYVMDELLPFVGKLDRGCRNRTTVIINK